MKKNQRACSHAGTPEQAGNGASEMTRSPLSDFSIADGPISSLLLPGAENGKKSRELRQLTGYDARTINILVGRERLEGIPILSDTYHGYYLSSSEEETADFVGRMRHRANEILEAAAAVERGGG